MKKQQQKKSASGKEKTKKLTLKKRTIKDLDPKTDTPKGGAGATGPSRYTCEYTCGY